MQIDVLAGLPEVPAQLARELAGLKLVDHHVHGCYVETLSRAQFEEAFNEATHDPIPAFMTQFDSQPGFAIRRWCAPLLGLERHAPAEAYWAARAAIVPSELNRRLLPVAGVEHWVIDTGYASTSITSPAQMTADSGAPASEIARLESIAEQLLAAGTDPNEFPAAFRSELATAAQTVKGFKTIVAYRTGFDINWSPPTDVEVSAAVARWRALRQPAPRLVDPLLECFVAHSGLATGLPLQFHVGFGDHDLDLHRVNPLLLLPLLRQQQTGEATVMLLHSYPFHREAGYLAQAFSNVYFDVGLGLNYVGTQAEQVIAESLETAPFAKQLYSSDAFGIPELHVLGAILWRRAMASVLGRWVNRGDWSQDDAVRVAGMIGAENARRVYGL